jgi:hypothetical protein
VCLVDLAEALLVYVGEVHWVANDLAVKAERWVGSRVGKSTARWGWLGKNCDWVAESADRAVGGRTWKEGGSSGKLNVDWGSRRVGIGRWGIGLGVGRLVDWRWHGGHDWGLSSGARAG